MRVDRFRVGVHISVGNSDLGNGSFNPTLLVIGDIDDFKNTFLNTAMVPHQAEAAKFEREHSMPKKLEERSVLCSTCGTLLQACSLQSNVHPRKPPEGLHRSPG